MKRNSLRVLDELGAGAIYIDQVACSRPKPCFDARHGHPLGGGNHWYEGYRRMLADIHAAYSAKGAAVTSEGTGEAWLGEIDGYLVASAHENGEVPFHPYVYSGRAVYFGSRLGHDASREAQFFFSAKSMLGGIVPGFLHFNSAEAKIDDLFALGAVRQAAADFFSYGVLLGELRPEEPPPAVTFGWTFGKNKTPTSEETPSVIGTWWKDASGSRVALAAANVSGEAREVRFAMSSGAKGMKVLASSSSAAPTVSVSDGKCTLGIGPSSVCVLEVEK